MTIDWDVARDLVDQQEELLMDLVGIFYTEQAEVIPRIEQAIRDRDAVKLHLYAHRLKGCLRYFGPSEASDLAERLESAGRTGTFDGTSEWLATLRAAVRELEDEMRAYQQTHQASE